MLFFGVGAGRCGTMTLANLLNEEESVVCCHEGKIRQLEESGDQWLPFLTLENYIAFQKPESSEDIFRDKRQMMPGLQLEKELRGLGDVAYNYAPFVSAIPAVFPAAKLIVLVRDGRDFVRSVYTSERPDPTPVGWLDDDVDLSPLERYVQLGRLRPADAEEPRAHWKQMTALEKNAWLWSETYRLIFDGLEQWNEDNLMIVKFEDFIADTVSEYKKIRTFLGWDNTPVPESVIELVKKPINSRGRDYKILKPWRDWSREESELFMSQASEMMKKLGYL